MRLVNLIFILFIFSLTTRVFADDVPERFDVPHPPIVAKTASVPDKVGCDTIQQQVGWKDGDYVNLDDVKKLVPTLPTGNESVHVGPQTAIDAVMALTAAPLMMYHCQAGVPPVMAVMYFTYVIDGGTYTTPFVNVEMNNP